MIVYYYYSSSNCKTYLVLIAPLQIMLPAGSKRDSIPVQCHLGKEVQLKHHAPVISITVLDAQVRFKSGSFARNWLWNSYNVYV